MANLSGGGSSTNAHGLWFEQETSLAAALEAAGYMVMDNYVFANGQQAAWISRKRSDVYRHFLEPAGIDWTQLLSKQMYPDEAFYNINTHYMYIIEKKFQSSAGSVDEKLQTCDFKKRQYCKLFGAMGIWVEYIYVCNNWFRQDAYRDVISYINSVGCHIVFNEIPLHYLGLPQVTQNGV